MTAAYSRLTTKSQTTIPAAVRHALAISAGDTVIYEIEPGRVSLRKLARADEAHLRALQGTFSEWETAEDAAAFDDL